MTPVTELERRKERAAEVLRRMFPDHVGHKTRIKRETLTDYSLLCATCRSRITGEVVGSFTLDEAGQVAKALGFENPFPLNRGEGFR
jgi:hypothetical protein